jgi:YidC/Oxa1 family membrane protein insertase
MSYIFHLFFYNPLYNGLIIFLSYLPHPDVGLAVILFTVFIKLILFPLSKQAVRTQMEIKEIEPELAKVREKFKENKEQQARETMSIYKKRGINPFSSFFLVLIQVPIIFALYFIFLKGGLPSIDTSLLYGFVNNLSLHTLPNMHFLGLFDVSKPQIILGALAGISQFIQVQFSIPPVKKVDNPNFKDDLARSMNIQMRYILPVFIFLISLKLSGAVTLYWITGNIFTIAQEMYMRKVIKKERVFSIAPTSKV